MSSYKLLEIYRLIQAYNIPWNLNFQTVYENPEKTLPRTRPGNNRTQFLDNSAYPNEVGQFASPWPFTVWCGSNCIPSPCLWLYLLEQHLNLKIWTTLNFESTSWLVCSQISWPSYLMSCSTPILLKISSTSLSLRSSIRNAISSCKSTESRSPSSQISTFSALVSPLFSADCRQSGKEWLNLSLCKPFVSGTFLNYLCFWSFSCPLWPQKDLVPDTLSLFTGTSLFSLMVWIWAFCAASWITPIFP